MTKVRLVVLAWLVGMTAGEESAGQEARPPVIDMHLHANAADDNGPPPMGICLPLLAQFPELDPKDDWETVFMASVKNPPCEDPIWTPMTDEALIERTVEVLERRNIIGVLSGPYALVRRWAAAAPDRIIPAVELIFTGNDLSAEAMRPLFESGEFAVLGEVENQYQGIAPDDERMEPYWALAEELDIPFAIHMGEGPPGAGRLFPKYRPSLGNPFRLEDVLVRHPRLRVYVMHYGTPQIEEMIAMLNAFPGLYVDLGGVQWAYPREYFYGQLKQFIDAGFGKRVMFGSDNINFPGVIEPAIAILEQAPFLSEEQKRDILYNNAARFLRLSDEEIARHHGR